MTTEAYFPIEVLALDSVSDDPNNPMVHDDGDMQRLRHSIETHGLLTLPVYNTTTGYIVGGHARVEALRGLGWRKAPFIVVQKDEDAEAAANIALNASYGHHDALKLAEVLRELEAAGVDLDDTGLAPYEIEETLRQAEEALAGAGGELAGDPDDVPDAPEEPITKPGDLIILGNHRLLCGDSTSIADVERVMAGEQADMVWTDPPYGVSYVGKAKDALTIQNDALDDAQLKAFLHDAFTNAWTVCREGASWYVAAPAGPPHWVFANVLLELKIYRQALIWVKNQFVLGHSDYHYRHEPIFYGWKDGAKHYFVDDRTQDSIWEIDRPQRSVEHPTMKPIELVARAIRNSTKPGQVVFEPFGGSGTTLIACEQEGRKSRLVELDAKYCDVIVRRWEQLTGKTAQRVAATDATQTPAA